MNKKRFFRLKKGSLVTDTANRSYIVLERRCDQWLKLHRLFDGETQQVSSEKTFDNGGNVWDVATLVWEA